MYGVAREVATLVRIRREVEELRCVAVVTDQLEAAAANHSLLRGAATGPRRHDVGAMLDERLVVPGRMRIARNGQQAATAAVRKRRPAKCVDHRRGDIHEIGDVRAPLAGAKTPRPAQHQRHAHRILEQRVLPPQAALAELVAMVGRVDDERVVGQPAFGEAREHVADQRVEPVGEGVVRGARAHRDVMGDVRDAPVAAPPRLPRMRIGRRRGMRRRRHAAGEPLVVFAPRHVRRMRQQETDGEAERIVTAVARIREFAQIRARRFGGFDVLDLIRRLADA